MDIINQGGLNHCAQRWHTGNEAVCWLIYQVSLLWQLVFSRFGCSSFPVCLFVFLLSVTDQGLFGFGPIFLARQPEALHLGCEQKWSFAVTRKIEDSGRCLFLLRDLRPLR